MDFKTMSVTEMEAEADRLSKLSTDLANKFRKELIAAAEANVDKKLQIAFMVMVTMELANAAIEATAKGIEKFGAETLRAEGELVMNWFDTSLLPGLVSVAKHYGRAHIVKPGDDNEAPETLQ